MFRENRREAVKAAIEKNDIPQIGGGYSERLHTVINLMLQRNPVDRIDLSDLRTQLRIGLYHSSIQSNTPHSSSLQRESTLSTPPLNVTEDTIVHFHLNHSWASDSAPLPLHSRSNIPSLLSNNISPQDTAPSMME